MVTPLRPVLSLVVQNGTKRRFAYSALQKLLEAGGADAASAISEYRTLLSACPRIELLWAAPLRVLTGSSSA